MMPQLLASTLGAVARRVHWRWLRRGASGLVALAYLGVPHHAAARSPNCEAAERLTLPNGVEVVLRADSALPLVAVVASVHVGMRDDPAGYEGLAHFVEHLTFRASENFEGALTLYRSAGAHEPNATTENDTTEYFTQVPAAQLERALWIEARRFAIGLDTLDDEASLAEREVLQREHIQRFGAEGLLKVEHALFEVLFPAGHPYRGDYETKQTIGRLGLDEARWFFARHYRPDNLRLVLVGSFDTDKAKSLVQRYFGRLKARAAAPLENGKPNGAKGGASVACQWAKPLATPEKRHIIMRTGIQRESISFLWPVAALEDPERWKGLFYSLRSSIQNAVQQLGVSHNVRAALRLGELGSAWELRVDIVPWESLDRVEPIVLKALGQWLATPQEDAAMAGRHLFELSETFEQESLLQRAQVLARRECSRSACWRPAQLLDPRILSHRQRFAPSAAVVVERRHDVGADDAGKLEVLP